MKRVLSLSLLAVPAIGWSQSLQVNWAAAAASGSVSPVPVNGAWGLAFAVLALVASAAWLFRRQKGLWATAVGAVMLALPWGDGRLQAASEIGTIELRNEAKPHIEEVRYLGYEVINRTGAAIRLTQVSLIGSGAYEWNAAQPEDVCEAGRVLAEGASCHVNFRRLGEIVGS